MTHSKRKYVIQTPNIMDLEADLRAIGESDGGLEVYYALNDIIDSVLDLRVNESMYFQPNRDDKNSKGIITRRA